MSRLTGLSTNRLTASVRVRSITRPHAGAPAAGRLHSASTCVQPSRMALLTGSGSKTAPSTKSWPRWRRGGPAMTGTQALALRQAARSRGQE
jgi:hypothetical protein